MRALLSGLTGDATLLVPVYIWEDYVSKLDKKNFFSFTPQQFLESLFLVKNYSVSGYMNCVSQERIGNNITTYDNISFGKASLKVNFDGVLFDMTNNKKPPQLFYPFQWAYDDVNAIFFQDSFVFPNKSLTQKKCEGITKVDTRFWNPSDGSPPDDYATGDLSDASKFGTSHYNIKFSLTVPWSDLASSTSRKNVYFSKIDNVYYVCPVFLGNVLINLTPLYTSSSFTDSSSILTSLNSATDPYFQNAIPVGYLTYVCLDQTKQKIPLYAEKDAFLSLDCNVTVKAEAIWTELDF